MKKLNKTDFQNLSRQNLEFFKWQYMPFQDQGERQQPKNFFFTQLQSRKFHEF